jgi:hypothetical protein
MPFDGGFSGGSSQVTALKDFNAQLMSTFGWSSVPAVLPAPGMTTAPAETGLARGAANGSPGNFQMPGSFR